MKVPERRPLRYDEGFGLQARNFKDTEQSVIGHTSKIAPSKDIFVKKNCINASNMFAAFLSIPIFGNSYIFFFMDNTCAMLLDNTCKTFIGCL